MTALADAPPAPGALGVAIPLDQITAYLQAITDWQRAAEHQLADLDSRAQLAGHPERYTSDVTLAWAMTQALKVRIAAIGKAVDAGVASAKDSRAIAGLIWGMLEGGAGLPVSFVEACSLTGALLDKLGTELEHDALAVVADQLTSVQVALDCCKRLGEHVSGASGEVDALAAELTVLIARARDGSAIGADLTGLATKLARLEQELREATDVQRELVSLRDRYRAAVAAANNAFALAARCRAKIGDPPKLAVPDPTVIGPPPDGADWRVQRTGLDDYARRLDDCSRAIDEATARFGAPLAERADLRGLFEALKAKAAAFNLVEIPALDALAQRAQDLLWTAPCDLPNARAAVDAYQAHLAALVGDLA